MIDSAGQRGSKGRSGHAPRCDVVIEGGCGIIPMYERSDVCGRSRVSLPFAPPPPSHRLSLWTASRGARCVRSASRLYMKFAWTGAGDRVTWVTGEPERGYCQSNACRAHTRHDTREHTAALVSLGWAVVRVPAPACTSARVLTDIRQAMSILRAILVKGRRVA